MKISELFHQAAGLYPNNVAIFDEEGTLTYSALSNAIHNTAELLKNHGVKAGMGIGVHGSNSRYFIILAYAVMECNAVVMPLSSQLSEMELTETVHIAQLHAIISEKSFFLFKNSISQDIRFNDQTWLLSFNPDTTLPYTIASHVNQPALIRFTSGTTGVSKGVVLSHHTIKERIESANLALQLGPYDRVLWVLSMAYHFVVSIILYLHHGSGIILCNDFMASSILDLINKHKATFLYAAPVHIRMLGNDTGNQQMNSIKKIVSTSTAISKEQCNAFYQRFKKPVSQAYGIIEIGLPVINFEKSFETPDAIGYAVTGYDVAILDDDFSEVAPGITGHLAMRGPGMLDAYLSPPVVRDQILKHGWFMTGDLASKSEDGLIKVEGRIKSMINVAGNKVFPEEVEAILNLHPGILVSRVSGYTHLLLGEGVQAELVVKPGLMHLDIEAIRKFCREHLSPHKIPQKILFVKELPVTDSGKLKR
ncbi:MAG: acyl--CoA ligase [Bacteroidota bacterium]|nr:acyl--CoA ligase [Bacteroidota bacterium]